VVIKWSIPPAFLLLGIAASAQTDPADTTIVPPPDPVVFDTTINYDELFQDFDAFMDSILSPNSYFLASVSAGKGYFNYESKTSSIIETSKKLTYQPTLGYYHRSGLGITATGSMVNDESKLNFYQFSLNPSFDYLKNRNFATGFSYTRFFTRDSLSFYTSPLQNELYAYFTYRKTWIRPSVAMSYGWGSRTDYQRREDLIQSLRLRPTGYTYINTNESISDFSLITSVRHDFYWLDVFTYNDHIRLTPTFSFTSGTQKFGFNQSSNTYATVLRTNNNVLYSTENMQLDNQLSFQPLSLAFSLKTEYTIGKFFIQPQFTVDYYFPAERENLATLFAVNTGFIF
jgi:hypothetical protein